MNCLDFKRLALSEPNSDEHSFVKHAKECPDCLKYVGSIRHMDTELSNSVDVQMPVSLMARLELNQLLEEETQANDNAFGFRNYAIAACLAAVLFVSGFLVNGYISPTQSMAEDYEALISGVVEHMNEQPLTPVWDVQRANDATNSHLANYDGKMQLKFLENLQFARICPMGKYRGLHATLDTVDGQVTFAYIKGDNVEDLLDVTYEGYLARVKPVRGGNLVIMSRTNKALQIADKQLEEAIYWNI